MIPYGNIYLGQYCSGNCFPSVRYQALQLGPYEQHLNRNTYIFIKSNVFDKVICKMSAILPRPQCVIPGFDMI